MSKHKHKNLKNLQNNIPVTEAAVRESLAQRETQKGLDLAKRYAKECPGVEAENLLAQAYLARIQDLQQAGLIHDAKNLIEVAKNRCPKWKAQFESAIQDIYQYPLTQQDVSRLVILLQKIPQDETVQQRVAKMIRIGLNNPRDLLECKELPPEHPLRKEAVWVWEALEAATNDMPEEERIQRIGRLSQISRRSPLVYWCFFIRALEAYYQKDDARATELLARIPKESVIASASYVLECRLKKTDKPTGLSSLPTRELWKWLSPRSLRSQWSDFMNAVQARQRGELREKCLQLLKLDFFRSPWVLRAAIKSILQALMDADIYDRSLQVEMIKLMEQVWGDEGKLLFLLDVDSIIYRENPFASADFLEKLQIDWEDKLTPKERAAILSRAAMYAQMDEYDFDDFPSISPSDYNKFKDDLDKPGHDFSIRLLKAACQLDPQPEYFDPLIFSLRRDKRKISEIERTLSHWHETCPNDCTPLIQLFEESEKRGALQKAIKFLEKAEQIDRLNPKVRNARFRLNWQIARKHLQQRKFHLVERDLQEVREHELKPAQQALFHGMKRFFDLVKEDGQLHLEAETSIPEAILFYHLQTLLPSKAGQNSEIQIQLPDLTDESQLAMYYDLREALATVGDVPNMPMVWFRRFPFWIVRATHLTDELLLRISKTILTNGIPEIVMASTARGLDHDGPRLHEFLFYRALALSKASFIHFNDVKECLVAVIAMCRARGDYELERQAVAFIKPYRNDFIEQLIGIEKHSNSLDKEISSTNIERILRRERKRTEPFPPPKPPKQIRETIKNMVKNSQKFLKRKKILFSNESYPQPPEPAEEKEIVESDNQPLLW